MPVVSPSARARPLAMNGNVPALVRRARRLQLLLGLADPGDLGAGVDHPRNGVEVDVAAAGRRCARRPRRPLPRALCASIGPRTTSPIAQTFGRLVRHSSSTATKPRSSSLQADRLGVQADGVRHAADRDDQLVARRASAPRPWRRRSRRSRRRCRVLTSPILTPSSIFRPCLANAFCASLAICSSTAPRNVGSASSTVTSAPRRRQTEPISRPITPEPIDAERLRHARRCAARRRWTGCVSSSNGAPGKRARRSSRWRR